MVYFHKLGIKRVMQGSRVKNSSRNILFSMIAYIVQIVLGFIVRRYFIYYFCEEYLGINSVFSNILSLLSLAELGFGTAIVFAMYKPMADDDKEKVRQLLQFYKKCYTIIGLIVLGIGLMVFPFMYYFKSKVSNIDVNFYVVYSIYLFNSVVSYFFSYRRSLLYTSQRNDIESKVNLIINIFSSLLQVLILFTIRNYYIYLSVSGIAQILNNAIIFFITEKKYGDYTKKPQSVLDKKTVKEINKNIFAMIYHKIGTAIVYSTDSLIIYFMFGSSTLGKYSNYLLITTYVTSMIAIITNAIKGSVGNSIASETSEKNYHLFKKLNFFYMWIVSFCSISIFILSDPFIDIVLTKNPQTNLLFNRVIITLISLNFLFSVSRYLCGTFKECAGLFYQDRFKPLFEALINLVVSIILSFKWGLAGVVLGTIVSSITTGVWVEPFVLYKYYFKKSCKEYFLKYLWFVIVAIVSGVGTYYLCNLIPSSNLLNLIIKFIICAIIPNCFLLLLLFWIPEFKDNFRFAKNLLLSLLKKQKKSKENNHEITENLDKNNTKGEENNPIVDSDK